MPGQLQGVAEGGRYSNLTASDLTGGISGVLHGIGCNSTSGGTYVLADADGTITGTVTPAAGQFNPHPCKVRGLQITITGTANLTVYWTPA